MHLFCLDMGGTKSRGGLYDASGKQLARAEGPGGALSLGAAAAEAAIHTIWADISHALGPGAPAMAQTGLFAGIAGLGLPGRGDELVARLSDFASAGLVSDGYGALIAETGANPGALISVGTGVIGLRRGANNQTLTLGGWGFPAGDGGGGAWIGLQAVSGLFAYLDGLKTDPAMGRELAASLMVVTGSQPAKIMNWLRDAQPRDFASLAPLVVAGAGRDDRFCQHLMKAAASEICQLAVALGVKGDGPVHLGGGLGPTLLPVCKRLEPGIEWRQAKSDPLTGLVRIATGKAPGEIRTPRPGFAGD